METTIEITKLPKGNEMYLITRIDQEDKKNHGYYLRCSYKGEHIQKFFADGLCGGIRKAKKEALRYREEHVFARFPAVLERAKRVRTNILGVSNEYPGEPGERWAARWKSKGKVVRRIYSVKKYGAKLAKELAVLSREKRSKVLPTRKQLTLAGK